MIDMPRFVIPPGVASRGYTVSDGSRLAVAYNTRRQSVTTLEGDSAEVYQRLFDSRGDSSAALAYIVEHGSFGEGEGAVEAAAATLQAFASTLIDAGYLALHGDTAAVARQSIRRAATVATAADPLENAEMHVGRVMADAHILYQLVLELTHRCNERCVHCYCPQGVGSDELTVEQLAQLLAEFRELGGFRLQLTGGELFCRKDLHAIFALVKEQGFVVDVTSNLTLLTPQNLDALVALEPRSVGCSIYSADPALHDGVTQLPGSWRRSTDAIRELRSRGIPVVLKTPLMNDTLAGWREVEALALELDCDYQFDLALTARNDGDGEPMRFRATDRPGIEDLFSSRYYRIRFKDEAAPPPTQPDPDAMLCGAGSAGLIVGPDGTIRPCLGLMEPLGRFPSDSLTKVWQKSEFFERWSQLRWRDSVRCASCADSAFCFRCPGAWELETGSRTKPPDYTCMLASAWRAAWEAQNPGRTAP